MNNFRRQGVDARVTADDGRMAAVETYGPLPDEPEEEPEEDPKPPQQPIDPAVPPEDEDEEDESEEE